MPRRHVIVNGDDFGLRDGVNEGIIEAHVHGILTSASLMVRREAAVAAAALCGKHPALGVGLHVDLGEWVFDDGAWRQVEMVVPTDNPEAVSEEVARQLELFQRLMGRTPTHLDSHQHVHMEEPARGVFEAVARRLSVPLRGCTPEVHHCGAFYGQTGEGEPIPEAIRVENLLAILTELPPGISELACHPGLGDVSDLAYGPERSREVSTLCHPRVKDLLERSGIELHSFADVPLRP